MQLLVHLGDNQVSAHQRDAALATYAQALEVVRAASKANPDDRPTFDRYQAAIEGQIRKAGKPRKSRGRARR
jgi:hypothetical protein